MVTHRYAMEATVASEHILVIGAHVPSIQDLGHLFSVNPIIHACVLSSHIWMKLHFQILACLLDGCLGIIRNPACAGREYVVKNQFQLKITWHSDWWNPDVELYWTSQTWFLDCFLNFQWKCRSWALRPPKKACTTVAHESAGSLNPSKLKNYARPNV